MGRPCSWTWFPYLFGSDGWLEQANDKEFTMETGAHVAAVNALLHQPYATNALKVLEPDGATTATFTASQQISFLPVRRIDLSTAEQTIYSDWESRIQTETNAMGRLEI